MRRTTLSLVLCAAMLAGCDALDGPPPMEVVPASASGLQVLPPVVHVDTLAVADGLVSIPLTAQLRIDQGDFPVQRVRYAVQWQFECVAGRLEASGEMEHVGGGMYVDDLVLEVPPGRRGKYRVTAWAVDTFGRPSNEVGTTFELRGTNLGPPVITSIDAPTEVQPPATLRFVVNVDDPDGIDHIARAEVDLPFAGTLPLSDTDTAGNNVPCDGTYSVAFTVPEGVEPGFVTFTFRAFDRDGAASDDVPFIVEVLP